MIRTAVQNVGRSRTRAGLLVGCLLACDVAYAGPIASSGHPYPEAAHAAHEAEHAVDHAWETYHKAALGGTIASPSVQAAIEQHLHEARALVPRAQAAADQGALPELDGLVEQIRHHANAAIAGSVEHKP